MRAFLRLSLLSLFNICVLSTAQISKLTAQELSEKSIRTFMEYAWSLTPQQFSKQDGTVIVIDKKKKDDVFVPLDVAREVIRVGRISAHAQICGLTELQIGNHRSLMKREEEKKIWTEQQMVYINQLHLTTVMLLTGRIKLVEKEGDKEVVVDEGKSSSQTCTDEQRTKVKDIIVAYVQSGPNFKVNLNPIQTGDTGTKISQPGTSSSKTVSNPSTKPATTSSLPSEASMPPQSSDKPQVKQ